MRRAAQFGQAVRAPLRDASTTDAKSPMFAADTVGLLSCELTEVFLDCIATAAKLRWC